MTHSKVLKTAFAVPSFGIRANQELSGVVAVVNQDPELRPTNCCAHKFVVDLFRLGLWHLLSPSWWSACVLLVGEHYANQYHPHPFAH